MELQTRDTEPIVKAENKGKPKMVNWTSLIILWAGIGFSAINGTLFDAKVLAGGFLLLIASTLTYYKYEIGAKVTLGVIALGVIILVEFSPYSVSLEFGFGELGVGFDLLILCVGIIHYFTNQETLSFLLGDDLSEDDAISEARSSINGYKNRFSSRSMQELVETANNERLLPYAIQAAKELIEERKAQEK